MSDLILQSSSVLLPSPGVAISIRVATLSDLPAIDALQKLHHKQLGFFPRAQMEGYLRSQWVLLAEEPQTGKLLGYCASRDRYLKRDELGVIYQLCIDPGAQRKFIGAALLRAVFERTPYGCKLYCCWCAQDIAANYFWESMGFVPLAFRTGGRACPEHRRRVHIFWQKRIVDGDTTTQYWFPSQTGGGAMGEDRLVLPIPPGVRWSDEMPRILPGEESSKLEILNPTPSTNAQGRLELSREAKQIQSTKSEAPKPKTRKQSADIAGRVGISASLGFFRKKDEPAAAQNKPVRAPRVKMKNDPKLIAAARELRDRWLEEVNAGKFIPEAREKYEVSSERRPRLDRADAALLTATPLVNAA